MGLRGAGALSIEKRETAITRSRQKTPWKDKGQTRAGRVIAFCESLKITQGAHSGRPVKLRPWQRKFILQVYRTEGRGNRPVRTAVLSMGRKNGKTAIAAMLALAHLVGPEAEERGEVYSAANDRFQAGKIFNEMVAMLKKRPDLNARCNIVRFHKKIEVLFGDGEGSEFIALSADVETKLGLSPSFVVYDELGQAKKRDLYDALDTAMGARANPLMVVISTQAMDDAAPLSELIDYGLKVQAGEILDPSFHLTLYAAPEDLDPWSPATWKLANPALADFRSLDDVKRLALQAQQQRSKKQSFLNLILNQRTSALVRFVSKEEWKACQASFTLDDFAGEECVAGLDLSAVRDLCSLVLAFERGPLVFAVPFFFMPAGVAQEREEEDHRPYRQWAEDGFLTLIPGNTNDPAFIASFVKRLMGRVRVKRINYDRWGMTDLIREFRRDEVSVPVKDAKDLKEGEEFSGLVIAEHGQGYASMGPAVKNFENLIGNERLRHPGNPVLTMCAGNTVVETDPAENKKFTKAKSNGRIDGMVALAMAARDIRNAPEPEKPSVYRERGALVV